jgi:hypothetical protein
VHEIEEHLVCDLRERGSSAARGCELRDQQGRLADDRVDEELEGHWGAGSVPQRLGAAILVMREPAGERLLCHPL